MKLTIIAAKIWASWSFWGAKSMCGLFQSGGNSLNDIILISTFTPCRQTDCSFHSFVSSLSSQWGPQGAHIVLLSFILSSPQPTAHPKSPSEFPGTDGNLNLGLPNPVLLMTQHWLEFQPGILPRRLEMFFIWKLSVILRLKRGCCKMSQQTSAYTCGVQNAACCHGLTLPSLFPGKTGV